MQCSLLHPAYSPGSSFVRALSLSFGVFSIPPPLPMQGRAHQARMPSKFQVKQSAEDKGVRGAEDSTKHPCGKYTQEEGCRGLVADAPGGVMPLWSALVLGWTRSEASHCPWASPLTTGPGLWNGRPGKGDVAYPDLPGTPRGDGLEGPDCSLPSPLPSSPSRASRDAGSPGHPCATGGAPRSQPPARLVQAPPGRQGHGSK